MVDPTSFLASKVPGLSIGGSSNVPSYEGVTPGKDPWGGIKVPSWETKPDWKAASGGIKWDSGFGVDDTGMFEKLFDKTKQTDKYRQRAEKESEESSSGGISTKPGFAVSLGDGLSAVQGQTTVLPGQPGSPGLLGPIAGAVAPFASAIPGIGPFLGAGLKVLSQVA